MQPHHRRPVHGRRVSLVAATALAVVASACSGGGSSDGPGIADVRLADQTTVVGEAPTTTVPAEVGSATYPRTVSHGLGDTEIEALPERVVAVSGVADIDALLTIGVEPIAAAAYYPVSYDADFGFAPWNQQFWGRIDSFLNIPEIDLEEVAAFEPDLIVGQPGTVEGAYATFTDIAPTVVHSYPSDWRDPVRLFGQALGREGTAEQAIAEIEAELDQQAGRVPDDPPTVAMVAAGNPTTLTVYTPDLGPGPARILEEVGIPSVDVPSQLSYENLGELAPADWIIVFDFTVGNTDELRSNPLFERLPAVAAGRVVELDPEQSFSWVYETSRSVPIVVDGILTELGL